MGFWDSVKSLAGDAVGDVDKGWDAFTSGAWTAPVPQVTSSPPPPAQAVTWTAPDPSASGHLMVQRDALEAEAAALRGWLPALESAISEAKSAGSSVSTVSFWSAGAALAQNLMSTCEGFETAARATSDLHAGTSKDLSDTSSVYEDAETANHRSVQNVNRQLT